MLAVMIAVMMVRVIVGLFMTLRTSLLTAGWRGQRSASNSIQTKPNKQKKQKTGHRSRKSHRSFPSVLRCYATTFPAIVDRRRWTASIDV
jgi:hypothetical protein